jgi:hypothetical protein
MLAYILAVIVAVGSFALYLTAFLFPKVHRKDDFLWSGVGLFYALVLWVCAGRITGGVLLGQLAGVSLLLWFGRETMKYRYAIAFPEKLSDVEKFSLLEWLQSKVNAVVGKKATPPLKKPATPTEETPTKKEIKKDTTEAENQIVSQVTEETPTPAVQETDTTTIEEVIEEQIVSTVTETTGEISPVQEEIKEEEIPLKVQDSPPESSENLGDLGFDEEESEQKKEEVILPDSPASKVTATKSKQQKQNFLSKLLGRVPIPFLQKKQKPQTDTSPVPISPVPSQLPTVEAPVEKIEDTPQITVEEVVEPSLEEIPEIENLVPQPEPLETIEEIIEVVTENTPPVTEESSEEIIEIITETTPSLTEEIPQDSLSQPETVETREETVKVVAEEIPQDAVQPSETTETIEELIEAITEDTPAKKPEIILEIESIEVEENEKKEEPEHS